MFIPDIFEKNKIALSIKETHNRHNKTNYYLMWGPRYSARILMIESVLTPGKDTERIVYPFDCVCLG